MIKKLLQRVFKAKKQASAPKADQKNSSATAKRIPYKTHRIDKKSISNAAMKTTEGLQKAGFEAFIVGGAVRDMLLGKHPRDIYYSKNIPKILMWQLTPHLNKSIASSAAHASLAVVSVWYT